MYLDELIDTIKDNATSRDAEFEALLEATYRLTLTLSNRALDTGQMVDRALLLRASENLDGVKHRRQRREAVKSKILTALDTTQAHLQTN